MSRLEDMTRLLVAYGRHQLRRRLRKSGPVRRLLDIYEPDHLEPLFADERELLPAMSKCINCGLCALAVQGRLAQVHLPDLASSYLRPYHLLHEVESDLAGATVDLEAAAAACPVGVPLPEVAAMLRRLSAS